MVYCGKPSRGCQMCRTRRIKCDEAKPTCNQCAKSRRQCPGYKDDFDIVFRNETKATERRARRGTLPKKNPISPISPISRTQKEDIVFTNTLEDDIAEDSKYLVSPVSDSGMSVFSIQGQTSLAIPVEEQAPCFFISNFVRQPRDSSSRGSFDFLLPIIRTERPDSHVSIAFQAVALASLANRPNSRASGLMVQAISLYSKALKGINLALQNPMQQKSDATLASILLMGFFETITSERTNVMAWGSHIEGAVQLTKLRGRKQLRTKTGLALFLAVRSQMIIHCMSASRSPMVSTDWWIADAAKDGPGAFVTQFLLRVAELRQEVNSVLPTSPREPYFFQKVLDLMRRSQAMEQEYRQWEETLPEEWRVKTVAWVDNVPGGDLMRAEVCPGRVDMFKDLFVATVWNNARVCRLFISGLIVRCAAWICYPVDYRTTPEYATCARVGVDMVVDILASIPYHLGWRLDENGTLIAGDLSGFDTGADDITSPKALGGFYCIWPLFCVISSDYATDNQRTWIRGRMNLIADVMGLNQARVIGSFLLRLPSMTIRRDLMGHAPPTAQQYAQWAAAGATKAAPPAYIPITTTTISKLNPSPNSPTLSDHKPLVPQEPPAYYTASESSFKAIVPRERAAVVKFERVEGGDREMGGMEGNRGTAEQAEQRATVREEWDKKRKELLKQASNCGGESAERIISDYLVI